MLVVVANASAEIDLKLPILLEAAFRATLKWVTSAVELESRKTLLVNDRSRESGCCAKTLNVTASWRVNPCTDITTIAHSLNSA